MLENSCVSRQWKTVLYRLHKKKKTATPHKTGNQTLHRDRTENKSVALAQQGTKC